MNKQIDKDLYDSLKTIIDDLGGIKSASRFLNIHVNDLIAYLEGTKTTIRDEYWTDYIKPVIKKNRVELLDYYSLIFSRQKKKVDNLFLYDWKKEKLQQEYDEKIEKLVNSPFNIYFNQFVEHSYKYDFPIIDYIDKIIKSEPVPFYKLVIGLDKLSQLYELFRPNKIVKDSPYHGTVKLMDAIYETFESVYNIKLENKFSKYGHSWVDNLTPKERNVDEINWKELLKDTKFIKDSINNEIAQLAMNSIEYFKIFHSFWFPYIIYDYIKEILEIGEYPEFSRENIKVGEIIIGHKIIKFNSSWECIRQLLKMFEYKKRFNTV